MNGQEHAGWCPYLTERDAECNCPARSASDAALIERLKKALRDLLPLADHAPGCETIMEFNGGKVCDCGHDPACTEARAALAVAEGGKGLCQNGDGNPVLRALLCAECIKRAQETGAFL